MTQWLLDKNGLAAANLLVVADTDLVSSCSLAGAVFLRAFLSVLELSVVFPVMPADTDTFSQLKIFSVKLVWVLVANRFKLSVLTCTQPTHPSLPSC